MKNEEGKKAGIVFNYRRASPFITRLQRVFTPEFPALYLAALRGGNKGKKGLIPFMKHIK
ncbi:MAG: hypothetical protein LBH43_13235 [Treponema sp.]|jgi:hypothetical protein|nr:hypothetical protein [Treponema sp.]